MEDTETFPKDLNMVVMKKIYLILALPFICLLIARTEVVPAPIFQSHMVLQQNMPVRIWGTASAGEKIHATLGENKREFTVRADGKWEVVFAPRPASFNPVNLVINDLVLSDILIGEVWLCSGQSNMAWTVNKSDVAEQRGIEGNPAVRYLKLVGPRAVAKDGYSEEELARCNPRDFFKGQWSVSSEHSVPLYSAVGWVFGLNLAEKLDVPVGIIETAVGGSAINNWLPPGITKSHPFTSHFYRGNWLDNTTVNKNHRRRAREAFRYVLEADEPFIPGQMKYRWMCEPSFLYEAGIKPLKNLSISGVVWYQGESDASPEESAKQYPELFALLIESFRRNFDNEQLPVLFVQLPGYKVETWPLFRETQRQSMQSIPGTFMAVTFDLGLEDNIHPSDKTAVGDRLSFLALKHVYKKQHVPDFPGLQKIKSKSGGLELVFLNMGDGFRNHDKPLSHFEIAGSDSLFLPAEAIVIANNKIFVKTSDKEVKLIRYGWMPFPKPPVKLYNSFELPVGPFIEKIRMD